MGEGTPGETIIGDSQIGRQVGRRRLQQQPLNIVTATSPKHAAANMNLRITALFLSVARAFC
jgi:hypothetical protein